jgi:hypothetical protein
VAQETRQNGIWFEISVRRREGTGQRKHEMEPDVVIVRDALRPPLQQRLPESYLLCC